jgi:DNA helicase-2/ATP-dependent DNA helicase PcrA
MPAAASAGDPWDSIEDADVHRFRLLQNMASAVDLAQRRFYDIAIQRLLQAISSRNGFRDPLGFNGNVHLTNRRSLALSLIEFMLTRHVEFLTMSALEVYNAVQQHVPTCLEGLTLPAVRAGKFRNAASACLYRDLIQSLKTAEETRLTRTIHQAKGGEAAAVFVVLDDDAVDHVLSPIAGEEEQRITYVALSRARDELFIYCPDTSRLPEFHAIGASTLIVGGGKGDVTEIGRLGKA